MRIDREKYRVIHNLVQRELSQPAVRAEPVVSGRLEYVTWLSDDILLMVGWFHAEDDLPLQAALLLGDRAIPLEIRCISYARPDISDGGPRAGKVFTARFFSREDARGMLGSMVIRTRIATFALGPLELSQIVIDLHTLAQDGLAWLAPETRIEVMEFLAAALTEHRGTTNLLRLNKNLFVVRELLRERLPICTIAPNQPQGLHVDAIVAVDETSFYIQGWLRDEEAKITRLTAVSPEGSRVELLGKIFRYPRPDVEQFYRTIATDHLTVKPGFICYFEIKVPSRLATGWVIEMRNAAEVAVEVPAPSTIRGPITARNTILASLPLAVLPNEPLMADHIHPAISRLQERHREMVGVESVAQHGIPNETSEVSIIIPLYGRIDFVEQQLAQFVHDPEIHQADLIYVLDSPELADNLKEFAAQLFQLYRIPFRVVILKRSVGYSAANNVGVSLAYGRLLLLLNSDVLPDCPGWLGTMVAFYDATPGVGALGPKLLYEDDSLQHAGMYFYLPTSSALAYLWQNMHYFKGLHRHLPAANVPRPVPALTGACLMIEKDLYTRVGGLQDQYVQGDHEDSDLCLRLIEAGYENWYLPCAELYHLEGQSYPGPLRGRTALYNRWLHTRLWDERIRAVMRQYGASVANTATVAVTNNRSCVLS